MDLQPRGPRARHSRVRHQSDSDCKRSCTSSSPGSSYLERCGGMESERPELRDNINRCHCDPHGDMVRMHETVDIARVREVPMMSTKDRMVGLDLFFKLMHRVPFPAEKSSLAQMTALLEILKCGGFYVDLPYGGASTPALQNPFDAADSSSDLAMSSLSKSLKGHPTSSTGRQAGMYSNAEWSRLTRASRHFLLHTIL